MRPILLLFLGLCVCLPVCAQEPVSPEEHPALSALYTQANALRDASFDAATRSVDFAADRLPARVVRPMRDAAEEFHDALEFHAEASAAMPRLEVMVTPAEERKAAESDSLGARLAAQLRLTVPF